MGKPDIFTIKVLKKGEKKEKYIKAKKWWALNEIHGTISLIANSRETIH